MSIIIYLFIYYFLVSFITPEPLTRKLLKHMIQHFNYYTLTSLISEIVLTQSRNLTNTHPLVFSPSLARSRSRLAGISSCLVNCLVASHTRTTFIRLTLVFYAHLSRWTITVMVFLCVTLGFRAFSIYTLVVIATILVTVTATKSQTTKILC